VNPAIVLDGASVDRGGTRVVHDVGFTIPSGCWFGLIGANGSGKTSLLRALGGRLPFATGTCLIEGVDLVHDRMARAERFGFLLPADRLPDALRVCDLLELVGGDIEAECDRLGPVHRALGIDQLIPIVSFVPMMLFAVLFGLSMDYEVFLLSRIREDYLKTGNNVESVVTGISTTARVITSAALIMVPTFFVISLFCAIYPKQHFTFANPIRSGRFPYLFFVSAGFASVIVTFVVGLIFLTLIFQDARLAWQNALAQSPSLRF
jgi:energy-coupling factor transporter ATP-binding protein EcfA2